MHAFRPLTEPPGASHPVLADRSAVPVEVTFDGARLASPHRLWTAVDGILVLIAGGAGSLLGSLIEQPVIGAVVLALVALVVIATDLVRTGRTPGHRALGVRTVDRQTGLSPALLGLARTRTVDIRHGRDPVLLTPRGGEVTAVPGDQWQLTASRALNAPVVLTLDSGPAFSLVGPTVIGRNPARVEGATRLLQVPDLTRTMSKSHALLEPQGGMLWVTDLGSMNGTAVASDGGELEPLAAHVRTVVRLGSTIEFGDRVATLDSAARPSATGAEEAS